MSSSRAQRDTLKTAVWSQLLMHSDKTLTVNIVKLADSEQFLLFHNYVLSCCVFMPIFSTKLRLINLLSSSTKPSLTPASTSVNRLILCISVRRSSSSIVCPSPRIPVLELEYVTAVCFNSYEQSVGHSYTRKIPLVCAFCST
jgi:hypothetical protein